MASPQQPEFAWIPEFKGLLVGKAKKEQFVQGRSVRAHTSCRFGMRLADGREHAIPGWRAE